MQAVPLKSFVSEANDIPLDDLCPHSVVWPEHVLTNRVARKASVSCDLSPARDTSTSDREALLRIIKARGIDPTSVASADMNFKFHVLLAVRSHRRCQDPAYRRFVLRMRMKAMYAFIASSKSSGLSMSPSHASCCFSI